MIVKTLTPRIEMYETAQEHADAARREIEESDLSQDLKEELIQAVEAHYYPRSYHEDMGAGMLQPRDCAVYSEYRSPDQSPDRSRSRSPSVKSSRSSSCSRHTDVSSVSKTPSPPAYYQHSLTTGSR